MRMIVMRMNAIYTRVEHLHILDQWYCRQTNFITNVSHARTHTSAVCTGWLQGNQQPTLSVAEDFAKGNMYALTIEIIHSLFRYLGMIVLDLKLHVKHLEVPNIL